MSPPDLLHWLRSPTDPNGNPWPLPNKHEEAADALAAETARADRAERSKRPWSDKLAGETIAEQVQIIDRLTKKLQAAEARLAAMSRPGDAEEMAHNIAYATSWAYTRSHDPLQDFERDLLADLIAIALRARDGEVT